MLHVFIAGCNGMLGQNLVFTQPDDIRLTGADIHEQGIALGPADYKQADLTDRNQTIKLVRELNPDVIVNAAAFTHVDKAETERDSCWSLNVELVEHLVRAASKVRARLVHVSTDYIFDGREGPYDEKARPNPLGYYGKSKLAAENVIAGSELDTAVIRTMVLYGKTLNNRNHFVNWLVNELKANKPVRIVDDQFGNTTLASELALGIWRVIQTGFSGTLNVAGSEIVNRYEFARTIARVYGLDTGLISPITTAELGQAAPRPLNSGLIVQKAIAEIGIELSDVENGVIKFKSMNGH